MFLGCPILGNKIFREQNSLEELIRFFQTESL